MTIWEITGNRNAPHSIIKLYINTLHQSIPFRRGSGPEGVRDLPRCLPERFNGVSHRSANGEAGEESIKKIAEKETEMKKSLYLVHLINHLFKSN